MARIAIFDSGVGGLTVAKAIHERLPGVRLRYLGDTARLPYGTKSARTVIRYALQAAAVLLHAATRPQQQAPLQLAHEGLEGGPLGHHQLGGVGGGGRAQIRGQVAEGEVHLVADGRHDGNLRREDRPDHLLLVEAPQVFQATATSADDKNIRGLCQCVGNANTSGDFLCGALALYFRRDDQYVRSTPASSCNFQKIPDRGAGRTGNESNPAREPRQSFLMPRNEQAFGGQSLLQLAERQLQGANAKRFDLPNNQLIDAARRIAVDIATTDNFLAILQVEPQT